ncbi:MAG: L-serine ammonia-lyase [Zymomonas mobilis]|uniref:L-serine dehydratase n=1 Tax=Zymomonas mobilis subsp. mobilis (strain ATCC 10988 / DSM 424 / LMG 404 / NCIMB 8938 / NRRL B-806 / ZM1) TaxID=555217 RepID=A0A0H3G195_ZYMMA|nr:L-serine ammonia-lyase [Zymomonas mobilis]ACV75567.1 L-serine dehydratase 1 [Zymomonas mobilis subsp. mobilis NCIMB 11163]AEH62493.1 L-serine dehydratase 1 [Zymomonas mobilis subsp. mobilis ATCC 10988]AHB10355.1 L-serine ammonia-lyase [Zymomonas mobilis subsp. mobilis str. CP4 = NRRL B-14023]AHJ70661.1 L-serine dehydratase 2 [Zymomonas mobilis subsp. mobilis NRRL B-12526]AHJ72515.1 L-serine dehydratase 2 [Zymomonas mobilis subsp. mobilis str. CP4 = NRRL B-14023]
MVSSVFELFKIGIGPSSSHTMGPMIAAADFIQALDKKQVSRIVVTLFGSLALTGRGHATDRAILLGLSGERPDQVNVDDIEPIISRIQQEKALHFANGDIIPFDPDKDILWEKKKRLSFHSNAMHFVAYNHKNHILLENTAYSIGGGTIVERAPEEGAKLPPQLQDEDIPYPYHSARDLLEIAIETGLSIADIQRQNELASLSEEELTQGIERIAQTMEECIERGMSETGVLPGGLRVRRRAPALYARLKAIHSDRAIDPLAALDWINLWALAVNEENASGGRIVTAPTNGAAGIIPAVLRYYRRFIQGDITKGIENFLLTATAIGALFKENASISGAEVGCQGEVGVACSMAAAGFAAALDASPRQIENAAEIGMEHNLGLTCDPIGGLVQVPCIERNAVGSIKAIEAARLAMIGDGNHRVSLDQVIETMLRTGLDMNANYKETSQGGLALC